MNGPTARMTVTDIADLAGVERTTVSNWQRRYRNSPTPFPAPLPDSPPGRPQFDAEAIHEWLTQRYPDRLADVGRGAGLVRKWRYTVSRVDTDEPTDPLAILIAAARGDRIDYRDSGDDRYPVAVSAVGPMVSIHATQAQAEAIREFLDSEIAANDNTELITAALEEYDNLNRWRRTRSANQAAGNLYSLFNQLVHEETESLLDFSCGTAALLAAIADGRSDLSIVGMEPSRVSWYIAQAKFDNNSNATIEQADIVNDDALRGRTFKTVVSIPPMGRTVDADNERMRRLPFGAVRGTADAAWPQLAVEALTPDGEAFLVLPHNLASLERADRIRRALIQKGLLAAVVTLPAHAHPLSKTLSDLWVLSAQRSESDDILFVDYSAADPAEQDVYEELGQVLCNWLDGPNSTTVLPESPRYVSVTPIQILDSTVNLDPLYWTARAAVTVTAPELLAAVAEASTSLAHVQHELNARVATELPDWALCAEDSPGMTVREASYEGWLRIIRRTAAPRDRLATSSSGEDVEWPRLRAQDADLMWRGEGGEIQWAEFKVRRDSLVYRQVVQPDDVIVWATPDRQIRSTVSPIGGAIPSPEILVIRCNEKYLDPKYLALTLTGGLNSIQITGSAFPTVRGSDLSFPVIPLEAQKKFAEYAEATDNIMAAARRVADAAAALRQTLADAAGSGAVGIAPSTRGEIYEK